MSAFEVLARTGAAGVASSAPDERGSPTRVSGERDAERSPTGHPGEKRDDTR